MKNEIHTIQNAESVAVENACTGTFAEKKSTVAIVRSKVTQVKNIQIDEIRTMVQNAVKLAGGFGGIIKDGDTVVIKPNLISNRDFCLPNWGGLLMDREVNGVTTDWRVTKAVAELVRQINPNGKVYVLEGSVINTEEVMQYFNYTTEFIPEVDEFIPIETDSGTWQDKNSGGIVKVDLPEGHLHKEYYLNKKYMQADVLISIPCMKNHWNAAVTGAVKNVSLGATPGNMYGIDSGNPARNNMVDHNTSDLHTWIHDYYLCRPVDFAVMDGLQGIQNGPVPSFEMRGTTDMKKDQKNMRLILAGRDSIALDTIETLVMNWDPQSVSYLTQLEQSGAGNLDVSKITVLGSQVDEVRKDFDGLIPPAGGSTITSKKAPETNISNYSVKNGILTFSLITDKETVKVEVHIDGNLIEPVIAKDFRNCTLDVGKIGKGKHEVKIWTFDRFLNRCENKFSIEI